MLPKFRKEYIPIDENVCFQYEDDNGCINWLRDTYLPLNASLSSFTFSDYEGQIGIISVEIQGQNIVLNQTNLDGFSLVKNIVCHWPHWSYLLNCLYIP